MRDNKKTAKILITLFLVIIMITSVLGFIALQGNSNSNLAATKKINGYKFDLVNGRWVTSINGQQFVFDNLPDQLKGYEVNDLSLTGNNYIIYDFSKNDIEDSLAKLELVLRLTGKGGLRACLNEKECDNELPIVDCSKVNGFYFKINDEKNIISKEGNCFKIEGSIFQISNNIDYINYKILGVI